MTDLQGNSPTDRPSEHMSQQMETIGRLAGGVAHDIRNSLTVIKGYCDLLLSGLPEEKEETLEMISEMRTAAQRAEDVTSHLLTFGRKQLLRPEKIDLNHAVAAMRPALAGAAGPGVDLTFAKSDRPAHVSIDLAMLEKALINLSASARDAMDAEGSLLIEMSVVSPGDGQTATSEHVSASHHVLLAVTDTGDEMDAETRQRVSEPFFNRTDSGGNTGLELAMVYGFIRQSGGDIHVISEPGQGTRFEIRLPLHIE